MTYRTWPSTLGIVFLLLAIAVGLASPLVVWMAS